MKRVYWRPQKISKAALFAIGLVAVGGTLALEHFPVTKHHGDVQTKIVAAELADRGMKAIRQARLERGYDIDHRFDPAKSGMIGDAMTPVTSLPGHLEAKQTSVNPNFAAVAVELLQQAGVSEGDLVAVGCTGSFPALNLALFTAIDAIGAEPIVIHSAASSQFGANLPDMLWLDMERVLYEQGIISFRTSAATLGGFGDRARGMSDQSQSLLTASIERSSVKQLMPETLNDSIALRMSHYQSAAAGRPIAAYVNVGGGAASIHGADGRTAFGSGLSQDAPADAEAVDCVATRFALEGVPTINLAGAVPLAKSYGLPIAPQELPTVGDGGVFTSTRPSRLLAGVLLVVVLAMVRIYVWTDLWARLRTKFSDLSTGGSDGGLRVHSAPQGAELMV
ncbi:poly-gamma-glutamate system protein [Aeoliella sp.]|uniref:poly-gamma-glutamate system protein n=1 Tax=Aeoliella sp. TaxID=2795800 RepID=UPI003CCBEF89